MPADFLFSLIYFITFLVILCVVFTISLAWWVFVEYATTSLRDTWYDKILSYPVTVVMKWL